MKLKNKKTGEILDDAQYRNYSLSDGFGFRMNGKEWEYHSLAELNEEWEDYEEPKQNVLRVMILTLTNYIENEPSGNIDLGDCKQMLEKLKAWERLKNKGFKFKGFYRLNDWHIAIRATSDESWSKIYKDLDLLFGGEE